MRSSALAVASLLGALAGSAAAQAAPHPPPPPPDPSERSDDLTVLPRVAVVVELAVNVDASRAEALSAALADALNRELEVDAFGGGDVSRRLPDDGLPDDCLATPACLADIAKRVDASQLLFLAVVQVGADIQIDASWADTTTGEVLARPRVVLPADARAGEVFGAAATRFLPHAKPRPMSVVQPVEIVSGPHRHLTRGTWIAGGIGLAAAAGAIGLGLSVRSDFDRCNTHDVVCDQDQKSSIRNRGIAADAIGVVAIAGVTTAVILYLRSSSGGEVAHPVKPDPTGAVAFTPVSGGAVVGVRGHF